MRDAILVLGSAAIAFAIGSIPFGLIVGRAFFAMDLRASGSGNIGAANAMRSYGKAGGAAVLALDVLKGYVPAAFFCTLWGLELATLIGAFAVLGHCFSPWLNFRGGKGVATWLGVLFGLSWISGLAFVAVWLAAVLPTRYASLGSLIASVLSPLVLWLTLHSAPVSAIASLVALVIVWKHRENIVRLREGRENKIVARGL
jgi:acyl phosphate:glycerol-3-phosphate acyltransferase